MIETGLNSIIYADEYIKGPPDDRTIKKYHVSVGSVVYGVSIVGIIALVMHFGRSTEGKWSPVAGAIGAFEYVMSWIQRLIASIPSAGIDVGSAVPMSTEEALTGVETLVQRHPAYVAYKWLGG